MEKGGYYSCIFPFCHIWIFGRRQIVDLQTISWLHTNKSHFFFCCQRLFEYPRESHDLKACGWGAISPLRLERLRPLVETEGNRRYSASLFTIHISPALLYLAWKKKNIWRNFEKSTQVWCSTHRRIFIKEAYKDLNKNKMAKLYLKLSWYLLHICIITLLCNKKSSKKGD